MIVVTGGGGWGMGEGGGGGVLVWGGGSEIVMSRRTDPGLIAVGTPDETRYSMMSSGT